MMRTEEAVSARNWLAKRGRLTSTEKIKSATAIERIVRMVLRLLLRRFLRTSLKYFMLGSPAVTLAAEVPRRASKRLRRVPHRRRCPCRDGKRYRRSARTGDRV